jgi:AmmeMemoRadiSam system protein A
MLELRDSILLAVARDAVTAAVHGASGLSAPPPSAPPEPAELRPVLDAARGVFVTLYSGGRLRGCIGTLRAGRPLREMLPEMAAGSATRDPRFVEQPIAVAELAELDIEISLLSPLHEARVPDELQVGVHGVYVSDGRRTGCFLPKVASQMGWSAEQFLSECCRGKAGLPADAWRRPEVTVRLFTIEAVGAGRALSE